MELREKLTIVNAFVHDVASGTWIGSLVLITLLRHETRAPEWAPVAALVPGLAGRFMLVTWISLAVIMATGAVRMVTFRAFGWTGDVARERVRLLKIKHALLGAVFLGGTAWQVAIVYF